MFHVVVFVCIPVGYLSLIYYEAKNFAVSIVVTVAVAVAFTSLRAAKAETASVVTNEVTFDALVQEALEKNPELNFYRAEIAAAKGERRTAGTIANPELSSQVGAKRARPAKRIVR